MGRRTFLLIASIVVAAIGTGLVAIYVNNADSRARAGEQLVTVYVAKEIIAANTPANVVRGKVQQEPVPQRMVSESTVTDLRMIAGKVTSAQVFPRTPLDTQMFGDQSQAPANVVPIGDGMVAVMVQMAEPARLAGLLQAGSQVTVYAPSEDSGGTPSPLINHSVTVLSPGGTVESATGGRVTTPSDTVTLELTLSDAAKVIGATSSGALYFVLLGGGTGSGDLSP